MFAAGVQPEFGGNFIRHNFESIVEVVRSESHDFIYLVRWEGEFADSYEPAENLPPKALETFYQAKLGDMVESRSEEALKRKMHELKGRFKQFALETADSDFSIASSHTVTSSDRSLRNKRQEELHIEIGEVNKLVQMEKLLNQDLSAKVVELTVHAKELRECTVSLSSYFVRTMNEMLKEKSDLVDKLKLRDEQIVRYDWLNAKFSNDWDQMQREHQKCLQQLANSQQELQTYEKEKMNSNVRIDFANLRCLEFFKR